MNILFNVSCFIIYALSFVSSEITVRTPEGEILPLAGFASHQHFYTQLQQIIEKKIQAAIDSLFSYSKISFDQILTNINSNQYLFLQLLHSLSTEDVTLSRQLLEQLADTDYGQKDTLNEWIRSNLQLPSNVMYRVIKSVANAKTTGIFEISPLISNEILLIGNKSELFLEACKKGDNKIIEWFLETGTDFDLGLPLEVAWEKGRWDIIKKLIQNGALDDIKVLDKVKNLNGSLLHLAAASHSPEAVTKLLEAELPIDALNNTGASSLYIAIESNNIDTANILLQKGANSELKTKSGNMALHAAASNGNLNAVKLLLNHDSSIYEKNTLGLSPLQIADKTAIFRIVNYLLQHDVDLPGIITNDYSISYYLYFLSKYGSLIQNEAPKEIESYCEIVHLMNIRASHVPFDKELKNKLLELVIKNKIEFLTQCLINLGGDITITNRNNETILFNAVRVGSYEIVRLLLNEGIDINAKNINDTTGLHIAASNGMLDIVSLLIKRGADINAVSKNGFTALHFAAKGGHNTVVNYLLDNKINVTLSSDNVITETPLQLAAFEGHLNIVKNLMKKNLFNDVKSNETWTTLHAAAKAGRASIVSYLLDQGFRINVADNYGKTPLFWAAFGGNVPTVVLLLQKGADIHTRSNYESTGNRFAIIFKSAETPLHVAAWNGHKEVCKILMDKGIDKNRKDAVGETPLYNAALRGHYSLTKFLLEQRALKTAYTTNGTSPLHAAAAEGHNDIVDLLLDKGLDIDVADMHGITPLYSAARAGHLSTVKNLIDKLADVNAVTFFGKSPLTAAVIEGHFEIVLLLLDKGANVEIIDNEGNTLVMEAISHGHEDIAKLLPKRGLYLHRDSKRKDGFTALHVAAKDQPRLIEYLLTYNVDVNGQDADGASPLFEAIRWDNIESVKALMTWTILDTNNTRKSDGWSCLHEAVYRDSLNIVELLLDRDAYIDAQTNAGDTPLHLAVENNRYKIAKKLIKSGANVNIKNSDGKTVFDVAKSLDRKEILNLRLCDCKAK
ncbi:ankyrin-3 [Halyomorpha halys]|uniref:ankyrin-3 n=1 Tax=Halyomorpha halys TaxID=286706 RepID=UPI0006D4EBC0|nr:ankyrin-3-like [Halyomorpha halys]